MDPAGNALCGVPEVVPIAAIAQSATEGVPARALQPSSSPPSPSFESQRRFGTPVAVPPSFLLLDACIDSSSARQSFNSTCLRASLAQFDRHFQFGRPQLFFHFLFELGQPLAMLLDDFVGVDNLVDVGLFVRLVGSELLGSQLLPQSGDLVVFLGHHVVGNANRAFDRRPLFASVRIVGAGVVRQAVQHPAFLRFPVHAAAVGIGRRQSLSLGEPSFELGIEFFEFADVFDRHFKAPLQIGYLMLAVGIDDRFRRTLELFDALDKGIALGTKMIEFRGVSVVVRYGAIGVILLQLRDAAAQSPHVVQRQLEFVLHLGAVGLEGRFLARPGRLLPFELLVAVVALLAGSSQLLIALGQLVLAGFESGCPLA